MESVCNGNTLEASIFELVGGDDCDDGDDHAAPRLTAPGTESRHVRSDGWGRPAPLTLQV